MLRKILFAVVASGALAPAGQALEVCSEGRRCSIGGGLFSESTTISIYGSLEPKVITETNADGEASTQLGDEDSTLGIAVETRLSASLTGFAQLEMEFSVDNPSAGFEKQDSAFLGVKGDFGKLQVGNFDSVYEDLIIDATEVAEDAEITDEAFASEDSQVAYYSPSWNGFSLRTQARIANRDQREAAGNGGGTRVGLSAAGGYTHNGWSLYVGFDDRDAETAVAFDQNGQETGKNTFVGESTYGIVGVYESGPLEIAAKHAVQNNLANDPAGNETRFTALRGTFFHGRSEFHGAYQRVDEASGKGRDELAVGASHRLFPSFSIWAEAGWFGRDRGTGDKYMVGVIYSF